MAEICKDCGREEGERGEAVECVVCYRHKNPRGRAAPMETANGYCDRDCPGYEQDPQVGELWPGELRFTFGYGVTPKEAERCHRRGGDEDDRLACLSLALHREREARVAAESTLSEEQAEHAKTEHDRATLLRELNAIRASLDLPIAASEPDIDVVGEIERQIEAKTAAREARQKAEEALAQSRSALAAKEAELAQERRAATDALLDTSQKLSALLRAERSRADKAEHALAALREEGARVREALRLDWERSGRLVGALRDGVEVLRNLMVPPGLVEGQVEALEAKFIDVLCRDGNGPRDPADIPVPPAGHDASDHKGCKDGECDFATMIAAGFPAKGDAARALMCAAREGLPEGWEWQPLEIALLRLDTGAKAASIWPNSDGRFTWHTWNVNGTGGENAVDGDAATAKREVVAALRRQAAQDVDRWHGFGIAGWEPPAESDASPAPAPVTQGDAVALLRDAQPLVAWAARKVGCLDPDEDGRPACKPECVVCSATGLLSRIDRALAAPVTTPAQEGMCAACRHPLVRHRVSGCVKPNGEGGFCGCRAVPDAAPPAPADAAPTTAELDAALERGAKGADHLAAMLAPQFRLHPDSITAPADAGKPCRCGSGAHPRRCERHPGAFERHVDALCRESNEDAHPAAEQPAKEDK